jgi:hypothetical protein
MTGKGTGRMKGKSAKREGMERKGSKESGAETLPRVWAGKQKFWKCNGKTIRDCN